MIVLFPITHLFFASNLCSVIQLLIVRSIIKKLTFWQKMYTAWWQWNFISTWQVFFFVSNIFKFKFSVAHFVLLLALFFVKNDAKNDIWTLSKWDCKSTSNNSNNLEHRKESKETASFHQLQGYWGMLSLSLSFFTHRPINAGVTGSCGFRMEIKSEKHSSGNLCCECCDINTLIVDHCNVSPHPHTLKQH